MNLGQWLSCTILGTRTPIPRRRFIRWRRGTARRGPARLPHYRAWMREQGCCACGTMHGVDPAHIGPHGYWQKAADTNCVPLCRKHHDELHQVGRLSFETSHTLDFDSIIEGLFTEWSEAQGKRPGRRLERCCGD